MLETAIGAAVSLIIWIKQHEGMRADKAIEIKRATSEAVCAVEQYGTHLEKGGKRDLERERKISQLWEVVKILVKPFSREMADRLGEKSNYWKSPDIWTEEEIISAGIQLEKVREELMTLEEWA